MQQQNVVYFLHGKESGPAGIKIQRLSKIAQEKGFLIESPDHSDIMDPHERAERLRELEQVKFQRLVLVGSSMGAYVATYLAPKLRPTGLFLMAPAFIPGEYIDRLQPVAQHCAIVHGWQDEVIPVDYAIEFARKHRLPIQLIDGDHRLIAQLPIIEQIFSLFLDQLSKD